MNTINRENYEEFCLDYLEGNLSEDHRSEFEDFMKENPDLDNDLKDVELFYLPEPENVIYSDKKSLMKKTTPVVRRMRPMYWKWAVAAACFFGIVGGVLFVQSNQDITTFADVNTQDEVINESVPNTEKGTNQKTNYEIANVEPEIINTPEEIPTTNRIPGKQKQQHINETSSIKSYNQTIAANNTIQNKGVEITPEIENDPFTDTNSDYVNDKRVAYSEMESLKTTQKPIAFNNTSTVFDSNDVPTVTVSEGRKGGLFGKRYELEEKGLLSDAYAFSVNRNELKETLTPDTYPIAISNEELKESFTPDTYKLEINKEQLKEAIIPESFAAVFK